MLRILTASSILALAAVPAIAQQADPSATPPTTDVPAPTEPSSAPGPMADPSSTPEPVTDPAQAPAPADASAAPAPAPAADGREAQVAQVVEAEFPIYDANKNGDLDQPEFNKWVLALHAASNDPTAKAMDEAAKSKWATDAFASADSDKNKKISKTEISKFLLG